MSTIANAGTADRTYAQINAANSSNGTTAGQQSSAQDIADRFLTLLVAQMQNQDPLNPMDNAQVTTQMAQINTVSGIQQLNSSIGSLGGQFLQMQAVQSASLVGHGVTLEGKRLVFDTAGNGIGGFELSNKANQVTVKVYNAVGAVVDTLSLGERPAGLNDFVWDGGVEGESYTFAVEATAAGTEVTATPLMRDAITAVSMKNGSLVLHTALSGAIEYHKAKAVN